MEGRRRKGVLERRWRLALTAGHHFSQVFFFWGGGGIETCNLSGGCSPPINSTTGGQRSAEKIPGNKTCFVSLLFKFGINCL